MTENHKIAFALAAVIVSIVGWWSFSIDKRVHELEGFAARGGRCTAEQCAILDRTLAALQRDLEHVRAAVAKLPPQHLVDRVADLDTRVRLIEREHADFRSNQNGGRVNP